MIASTLLALALANVVTAQASTASLLPVGFQEDGLQGEAVGTGADGTTYVLSGTFDTLSIPFTMTLVQDATHVSENAVIATEGASFFVNVECGLSNGQASCTEIVSEGSSSTVITETGAISLIGVPLGAGSATVTSGSASATSSSGASQSITFSSASAGSGSLSQIPASISVSSKSTATLTTPTSAGSTASSPSATSGASKTISVGFGLALPALLAFMTVL